ncbi:ribosomal protein L7Ae-like RNA K-turn-binding protein [Clostridium acetobutylicum]|uniref:Possibly nucleic acid binding protein similar to ribosomal protein HS6-type, YLXQ B.subtilis ortholog n=1 Tax=Clostridium acetobutylicum (strain ATCC 824 / DSM 792 / JCM 1419 / IAM 19013 / LMG 5710 / NBRC 13948 / NRRL B-527 / VKM B-1787 / 2291 / W) TaxID=272562 RepID=Q97I52_CLOAB|nr:MULTISPECIES: 50S ribosomal protein L7ae-like protein [Clostridium]AAK79766.1 Possibly nucleic acid binding protein similar to ribosomal protein HS6-type, YLXQ B.subtilis ortholog [Clostridium acetobutylicum ATCC 824]ADZ20851.1 Conserved hypothetical protein [Clostridium acetobutylicum EA 2018]AEI31974.1 ribosomal protein L7Ae family protein [Clostridium acetobutylicum DSM 1731]AWV79799.1 50S ribosomal protein L7ae-like protein [Clostridium acetobutylicum]KHD38091.1 ribosomal protein L7Ae f
MNNKFLQFLGIAKKAGKLVEGYNKCEELLLKRKADLIILSTDISENSKKKFENYSSKHNIDIINAFSSSELGNILGSDSIKVVCIVDKKISEKLKSLLTENN